MSADDAESDDAGYVHRPGASESPGTAGGDDTGGVTRTDDPSETAASAAAGPGQESTDGSRGSDVDSSTEGFGSRGWILVGVLVVCTLVVPGIIYLSPGILSAVGIPYIASLLVLPLLPAAVLGITAVWAMSAATHGDE